MFILRVHKDIKKVNGAFISQCCIFDVLRDEQLSSENMVAILVFLLMRQHTGILSHPEKLSCFLSSF